MLIIGGPFVCLIPDILYKTFSKVFYPNPKDKVLHLQKIDPTYNFKEHYIKLQRTLELKKR